MDNYLVRKDKVGDSRRCHPDLAPMQERMMDELETRMAENLRALDPETLVKTWMPMTMQGWGDMQKMFWGQMGINMPDMGAEPKSKKK